MEANQNRPQSKPTTAPKKKESEVNLPVPIPLVGQFITTAFANVGMVGGMPTPLFYLPTKGMIPSKDGNGIPVLRTPGGGGVSNDVDVESFPVQRRQPDVKGIPADKQQKPDIKEIPAVLPEERGPQVGAFPRTPVTGADVLMAKKPGGNSAGKGEKSEEVIHRVPKSGISDKEGAKGIPSRFRGERPRVDEDGTEFADRLLRDEGKTEYGTGPRSDFNQLKKYADRNFEK